jgi:hypothetical protein
MPWTSAEVQRLELRKRSSLGLGTRTGAPGQVPGHRGCLPANTIGPPPQARPLDRVHTPGDVDTRRQSGYEPLPGTAVTYDVTAWPGFPVLQEMQDFHTFGSRICLAEAGNQRAAIELGVR